MSRSALPRLVCALLVTILSALPLAAAEPTGPATPRIEGLAAGLSSLWSWLAGLWSESGCFIDPYGGCLGDTSAKPIVPAANENGCYIDPHGGCHG
jgi:hypothetical protein